tara:strand:+ start:5189 stop:6610 length:1422 start_codon:yes stop_codon:yes gene_type:complete
MDRSISKDNSPRIIFFELNEVPRRLFDFYVDNFPDSSFARIAKEGTVIDTITYDNGELHPWSTWPTVHRGIDNTVHNIRYLNQDLSKAKKFKPIWEILIENKIDVGIFGSLHSYPPIKSQFCKFYLPDTFAPDSAAFPSSLKDFQSFNLELTNQNKALSREISTQYIRKFFKLIIDNSITKTSAMSALIQIFKEKINRKYKTRRSILQNVFSFDLYLKNMYKFKPSFSTYFTNHVAGMMHRYWKYLFYEDFNLDKSLVDRFHAKSILKAMHLTNKNLNKLIRFAKLNDYEILIVSSMGQSFIDRGKYIPEITLKDLNKFLNCLELDQSKYNLLPAMYPDYCIEAKDLESMNLMRENIKKLLDDSGEQFLVERYDPVGLKINLIFKLSDNIVSFKKCTFLDKNFKLKEIGLELIKRDIGTGYHIPEGIFCWWGKNNKLINKINLTQKIDTRRICPTIMKIYGIDIPKYMQKPFI